MKSFITILLIFILNQKIAQSAYCKYEYQNRIYIQGTTCMLSVEESESDGNIRNIDGIPVSNKVLVVTNSNSLSITALPSKICEKFTDLQAIWLAGVNIEEIQEDSLINCRKLVYLDIPQNKIRELPANVFASQSELEILYLYENLIEELPANVFAPLKKLRILSLSNNRLTTLDSAAFGDSLKLKEFYFKSNQLESFDERIIASNPGLEVMDASSNPCVEGFFTSWSWNQGRYKINIALKKCFKNFVELEKTKNHVRDYEENEITIT